MPRALDVIQSADFRRAGRDPNHAGAQFSAQTGEDIIVNVGVLTANQRHGANLADQLKIVFHTPFLSFLWRMRKAAAIPASSRFPASLYL
jgi:hypothetical protein